MLDIKNLIFSHPGQPTPYNFSLCAMPGQITAVTGPSGAGKSTLLDLIAGFLIPISGMLSLNNQNLIPLPPEKRPVSILFQSDNLFDHLSVENNLKLGLPTSMPNSKKALGHALHQVGLASYHHRGAKNLSGGQQQRVALARTLLRNQPIVLLDEPFANLDNDTANSMRDLVKTLTKQNNWITILVSHSQEDATKTADQTYPLLSGVTAS